MTRIFQFTGIRGRLFLAFGSVAAMTAVATVIAWISFGGVGDSLKRIVTDNIPTVVLAASLAEKSGIITATAPALAAAVVLLLVLLERILHLWVSARKWRTHAR